VSGSLGIIISFILNKYWTFSNQKSKLISQGYKMFISYVFSILLGAVLITLYINILTWQNVIYIGNVIPTMSNFLTVGTIMIMNFFIYKYIVFK
jgi:putative flippase GtrA